MPTHADCSAIPLIREHEWNMQMALLSKDVILKAKDLVWEDIPVPEWAPTDAPNKDDLKVRLMTLTGTQRDDFEAKTVVQNGKSQKMNLVNFRARLLALCIVDEQGNRMFNDTEIPLLGNKSANVLERLFDKAREMNGMSEEDVEELTEGLGSDQSDSSTSD